MQNTIRSLSIQALLLALLQGQYYTSCDRYQAGTLIVSLLYNFPFSLIAYFYLALSIPLANKHRQVFLPQKSRTRLWVTLVARIKNTTHLCTSYIIFKEYILEPLQWTFSLHQLYKQIFYVINAHLQTLIITNQIRSRITLSL